MRPITLTMKAFGSFINETVSFEDFKSGLYLVVGETGAGKTTIFDAIVFALFGKASGSNREAEMMHSDYVDKSVDTEVKLVFTHGGKQYTAKRTLHFPKKQGTKNEYGKGKSDAELDLPEGLPVKGHAAVTKRCEELLGLDADQFCKIVMLAQGEFREFLAAGAEDKSKILGKLFDSSEYVRFQNLLNVSRASLAEKRKKNSEKVKLVMNTAFQQPEDMPEEEFLLYLPGEPNLVDNLNRLVEEDGKKMAVLNAEKEEAQKAVNAIHARIGAAEGNNKLLEELDGKRDHLRDLEDRAREMEQLEQEHKKAEKALHRVIPVRDRWAAARETADGTNHDIARLRVKLSGLEDALKAAQSTAEEDAEKNARINAINTEYQNLLESLPKYDELDKKCTALKEAEDSLEQVKESISGKEAEKNNKQKQLEKSREELAGLEDAEAAEARLSAALSQAQRENTEFNGTNGIKKSVMKALAEEAKLAEKGEQLNNAVLEAGRARDLYDQLYWAFISGQAGIMASKLEKDLKEKGTAVCPVCHSVIRADQPHAFAPHLDGTPTQKEVDEAKKDFDRKDETRREKREEIEGNKAALKEQKSNLLERANKLLPDCGNWEELASEDYLAAASAKFSRAETKAAEALAQAKERVSRKTALKGSLEELNSKIEELAANVEKEKEEKNQIERGIAALRAEVETLQKALPHAAKSEAVQQMGILEKEQHDLKAIIERHQKALENAREAQNQTSGELSGKEKTLPGQEQAAQEALERYGAALAENGFSDAAELEAVLVRMGRGDREKWLTDRQKELNEYRNDCQNTKKRIAELTEQTKDLQYVDITELNAQLSEAEKAQEQAGNACTDQNSLLQNHVSVLDIVSKEKGALTKTDAAWERLDRLAELAIGASGEGGKLSFERYVMGSIFREVLAMANRRLDLMSGGQYSLEHITNAGRSNSAAGLEIEVFDNATGKQRPANSLSGGESFQVSLSLALGLSDVVQSHAGGIGLDTLFIDEGFGALDSGALDNAIKVLNQLTEGNRLVGIISHVDKLEESIPQKIRVKKTAKGSKLEVEV